MRKRALRFCYRTFTIFASHGGSTPLCRRATPCQVAWRCRWPRFDRRRLQQFLKIAVTKPDSKRHVLIVDHPNPISAGARPPDPRAAAARETVIEVLATAVFALILDRTRSAARSPARARAGSRSPAARVEPHRASASTAPRKERRT